MKKINKFFIIIFLWLSFNTPFVYSQDNKTYVFFTCDVESMGKGNPGKDIWGKSGNEYWGVTKIMDMLDKYNIKGTFFVNVYESAKFGDEALKNVCLEITRRKHDLGLHTHPQVMFPKIYGMQNGTLAEQSEIIRTGKELIRKWTGKEVIAHRAGAYLSNHDTLKALSENGILFDSSTSYAYRRIQNLKHPISTINKIIITDSGQQKTIEIPVTIYGEFKFMNFVDIRVLDMESTSLVEFKEILKAAIKNDVKTVVIMSHSFSFIRYNKSARKRLEKKLDLLLSYIKSQKMLDAITFTEFSNRYKENQVTLEGEDFLPITGVWLAYLRSWERLQEGYANIFFAIAPIILFSTIVFILAYKFKK